MTRRHVIAGPLSRDPLLVALAWAGAITSAAMTAYEASKGEWLFVLAFVTNLFLWLVLRWRENDRPTFLARFSDDTYLYEGWRR